MPKRPVDHEPTLGDVVQGLTVRQNTYQGEILALQAQIERLRAEQAGAAAVVHGTIEAAGIRFAQCDPTDTGVLDVAQTLVRALATGTKIDVSLAPGLASRPISDILGHVPAEVRGLIEAPASRGRPVEVPRGLPRGNGRPEASLIPSMDLDTLMQRFPPVEALMRDQDAWKEFNGTRCLPIPRIADLIGARSPNDDRDEEALNGASRQYLYAKWKAWRIHGQPLPAYVDKGKSGHFLAEGSVPPFLSFLATQLDASHTATLAIRTGLTPDEQAILGVKKI